MSWWIPSAHSRSLVPDKFYPTKHGAWGSHGGGVLTFKKEWGAWVWEVQSADYLYLQHLWGQPDSLSWGHTFPRDPPANEGSWQGFEGPATSLQWETSLTDILSAGAPIGLAKASLDVHCWGQSLPLRLFLLPPSFFSYESGLHCSWSLPLSILPLPLTFHRCHSLFSTSFPMFAKYCLIDHSHWQMWGDILLYFDLHFPDG